MLRIIPRALALGCVGVAVSACNLTASQSQINDALNGGVTTPFGLSGIGLSTAQIQKVTTIINQVRTATKTACGFLPTVTSVQNIIVALNPDIASVSVPVTKVAQIACTALSNAAPTSYTAGEAPEKAKKAPAKAAEPKVGETVTKTIIVKGQPVAVTGTKTK
ncbi:hypothetical protein [Methylobacterium sp. 1973]|uniref:hypothetical protein n=1 Tax=Methylobacterium sp. 1973 TaxID=3156421 RepID=UPI00339171AD